jgi:hypothetical protein
LCQLEKDSHERQLEQAIAVDEFMRLEKFTNIELRRDLVEQARELRYVSFQLAQELKRDVEVAYKFELGEDPPPSDLPGVLPGGLNRDLFAGRRLLHDLRRIEAAYNERHAEPRHHIFKNVSLRRLAPVELIKLRATGTCSFSISELDYDMDFPGQWDRRFKAIRASVHCVTGRYEGVNCILRKTASRTRRTPDRPTPDTLAPDPHVECSIAVSTGRADSGRFDFNLNDERRLDGEHEGAISDFTLEIASPNPGYDSDTIADVVLELLYTAREATDDSRTKALAQVSQALSDAASAPLALLFSVRHDLPDEWQRLADASRQHLDKSSVRLTLDRQSFPIGFQSPEWTIGIRKVELYLKLAPTTNPPTFAADELKWSVGGPSGLSWSGGKLLALDSPSGPSRAFGAEAHADPPPGGGQPKAGAPGEWTLDMWRPGIGGDEAVEADDLKDVLLVCHYSVKSTP